MSYSIAACIPIVTDSVDNTNPLLFYGPLSSNGRYIVAYSVLLPSNGSTVHNIFFAIPFYLQSVLVYYTFSKLRKNMFFFVFFITPVYLQSVQNTMSKWEETETNGEEESSVALIHMEEAQAWNGDGEILQTKP
jgi:hypothetical protein